MARKHIILDLDEKAKEFLVNKGFQPEMGARPLRRVIEQYLEDPLAEKLLMSPGKGAHFKATAEGDKIVFVELDKPAQEEPMATAGNEKH